jgi:hypothetical protein
VILALADGDVTRILSAIETRAHVKVGR